MLKNKIAIQAAYFAVFAFGASTLFSSAHACQNDASNCKATLKGLELTVKDSKPGNGKCTVNTDDSTSTKLDASITCE
jgi:hypothetical protein